MKAVDQFGDHYIEDTDADKLEEIMDDMTSNMDESDAPDVIKIKERLENEILKMPYLHKHMYFMHYKDDMAQNDNNTNLLVVKMKAHSIPLTNSLEKNTTHIILNDSLKSLQRAKLEEVSKKNKMTLVEIKELMEMIDI